MKNFLGKYLLISIILFFNSCNSYHKFESSDFKENLEIFENLVEKTNKYGWLKNNVDLFFLEKKISPIEFETLKKLNFKKIEQSEGVLLFIFSYKSNDNFLDKKINNELKTNTINKTCNHFLFYSKNETILNQVSNYENYSECRKRYKIFNKYWRYSEQLLDCED